MEWYVTNSSDTNLGTVQSHLGTVRMSYMYGICGVSHFCGKTACQKYFFQIDSKKQQQQKTLRLWISKIQIWIWSEESTQSVDFMDSRSVFGFAPQKRKI